METSRRLIWALVTIATLVGCGDQEVRVTLAPMNTTTVSATDTPTIQAQSTPRANGAMPTASTTSTSYAAQSLRVESYSTIQQLLVQSVAVVRVTVTNAGIVESATVVIPTIGVLDVSSATVTVVRVDQVLFGSVSGPEIKVRQIGTGKVNVRGEAPLMEVGKSYVLFLRRFTYGPGRDTDQYIAVGGSAGLYADEGGTLRRLDPGSPQLPAMISLPDLQRTISMVALTPVVPSVVATVRPGSPSSVPSAVTTAGPVLPPTPSR